MRGFRLAAAIAASFAGALLASPAGSAIPQLALACGSAAAGQDVSCTISRVSGGSGVFVTFATSDGTARAGTDYAGASQLIHLKGGQQSATVAVHTLANPGASGTLTFTASISAGVTAVRATASIVEPAPPSPPPPPPPPPPSGSWVAAPLAEGGYAQVVTAGSGVPRGDLDGGFDANDVYRSSIAGEYVKLSAPSFAFARSGVKTCFVQALSDHAPLELNCADLTGVAPVSGYTPPF